MSVFLLDIKELIQQVLVLFFGFCLTYSESHLWYYSYRSLTLLIVFFFPINAGIGAAFSWDSYESGVANGVVFLCIGMFKSRIASYWAMVLALRDRNISEFTVLRYPSHLYALHFPFSSEQFTEFLLLNLIMLLACIYFCV